MTGLLPILLPTQRRPIGQAVCWVMLFPLSLSSACAETFDSFTEFREGFPLQGRGDRRPFAIAILKLRRIILNDGIGVLG